MIVLCPHSSVYFHWPSSRVSFSSVDILKLLVRTFSYCSGSLLETYLIIKNRNMKIQNSKFLEPGLILFILVSIEYKI